MSLVQYIHNQLQRWAISQRLFDFNISQRRGSNGWKMLVRLMSEPSFEFWAGKMSHILWSQLAAIVLISSKKRDNPGYLRRGGLPPKLQCRLKWPQLVLVADMWTCQSETRGAANTEIGILGQHWNWHGSLPNTMTRKPQWFQRNLALEVLFLCRTSKNLKHQATALMRLFLYSENFTWYFFCMCGDGEGFEIHPFV